MPESAEMQRFRCKRTARLACVMLNLNGSDRLFPHCNIALPGRYGKTPPDPTGPAGKDTLPTRRRTTGMSLYCIALPGRMAGGTKSGPDQSAWRRRNAGISR